MTYEEAGYKPQETGNEGERLASNPASTVGERTAPDIVEAGTVAGDVLKSSVESTERGEPGETEEDIDFCMLTRLVCK